MKIHMRKSALLIALILLCTSFLAACGGGSGGSSAAGSETSQAEDGQTADPGAPVQVLRVGMECAYPPFNWTQMSDANGGVAIGDGTYAGGYDVEIAKLVAEHLGAELQIVKTEWDGLSPGVTSGKLDLIIAGMSATEERRQTLDFSDDYYTSDLVVVVQKDSEYASATTIQDFAGAKITGQLNTLHYDVIDQIEGVDKQAALEDFPTMTTAVTSGKIDGYVSERPGALSAIAANPDLVFIDFTEGDGFDYSTGEVSIAIGMAKDSELLNEINECLAGISAEQRLALMEQAVLDQPLSN